MDFNWRAGALLKGGLHGGDAGATDHIEEVRNCRLQRGQKRGLKMLVNEELEY